MIKELLQKPANTKLIHGYRLQRSFAACCQLASHPKLLPEHHSEHKCTQWLLTRPAYQHFTTLFATFPLETSTLKGGGPCRKALEALKMLGMWDWLPLLLCCYKDQSKDLAVSWVGTITRAGLAAPPGLKESPSHQPPKKAINNLLSVKETGSPNHLAHWLSNSVAGRLEDVMKSQLHTSTC